MMNALRSFIKCLFSRFHAMLLTVACNKGKDQSGKPEFSNTLMVCSAYSKTAAIRYA